MRRFGMAMGAGLLVLLLGGLVFAQSLVKIAEDGEVLPDVASKWTVEATGDVTFTVPENKAEAIAEALTPALADYGATISVPDAKTVRISGLKADELFPLLAEISLPCKKAESPQQADALAALAGPTAAADIFTTPDGSSSIRVAGQMNDQEIVARQFTAKVIKIDRSLGFPYVKVLVSIETEPIKAVKGVALKKGEIVTLLPFYAHTTKPGGAPDHQMLDTGDEHTRINIGAWYLKPGDMVTAVPASGEGKLVKTHFIKRKY